MQRQSGWITEERLNLYALAFVLTELALVSIVTVHYWEIPMSQWPVVMSSDFRVFWAAGHLALHGDPVGAYDAEKIFAVMRSADPTLGDYLFGWFYPPSFLLMMMPFALLPWVLACSLFVISSLSAYLVLLRKIAAPFPVWWFAIGFFPVLITVANGQNAFLTATLAGVALIQLDRRPVLSGVCIGLLAIKPQLAVLFPLALICGRHWKTLGFSVITSVIFIGLSTIAFGTEIIPAFLKGINTARNAALTPGWPLDKMTSAYAASIASGFGEFWANAIHCTVALVAAYAVIKCWRQGLPSNLRNSVLILASLLVSPHLFSYDLTWFALPIIWMAKHSLEYGWLKGEQLMLIFAWQAPIIFCVPAAVCGPNLTPIFLIVLLAYCVTKAATQHKISAAGLLPERLQ